ncbi:FadR/GntR family transcriptional regulator [Specibacter sp. RAF43]|uniref:FadR/GntR family transcriptional regulator n=1 Tax=Specibacter sp. RAF43 TaxID=3233057 RepID=UPI003F9A5CB0
MSLSPLGASRSLAAVFTPIKSGGLVDEVCRRIELAVETGLLGSGQRLPNEIELAGALGVSAVTAREALSQLRGQGLIRTTRGRSGGSFVTENSFPSPERAREQLLGLTRLQLTDLGLHFQAIAVTCAGVAAKRSSSDDVQALEQFISPPAAPGEPATAFSWRLTAAEFMLEVAAVARSARLARELLHLQADMGTLTLLPFEDPRFCQTTATLHGAIIDAIATHDTDAAEARTKELITAKTRWLLAEHAAGQQ